VHRGGVEARRALAVMSPISSIGGSSSSSLVMMQPAACDATSATKHPKTSLRIGPPLFVTVSELERWIENAMPPSRRHHARTLQRM
jgi:hypothetical protein